MTEGRLNDDFRDLLIAMQAEEVAFLVVGAYAVAAHGAPRATGDLDVLVRPDSENAARVYRALVRFGAPVQTLGIVEADFARPGMVCQIGLPPRRIDVLTAISGVTIAEAWVDHIVRDVDGIAVRFPSKAVLIRNKKASGRMKDLADVERLESDG